MSGREDGPAEAPHPRESPGLIGHAAALRTLGAALGSGRMAHGWILAGPEGIGKATLAYALARHLLHYGITPGPHGQIGAPPEAPASRQVAAGTHPDLVVLARPWDPEKKRFKADLPVDEIRRLLAVLAQHTGAGGARVALIDSADDMNRNAANALLKALEEPPARTVVLLISHAPGRLLPTIRSRCRLLTLAPLREGELEAVLARQGIALPAGDGPLVHALAAGSAGHARALLAGEGLALYRRILALLARLPAAPGEALEGLTTAARGEGEEQFQLVVRLLRAAWRRLSVAAAAPDHDPLLPEERPALATIARLDGETRARLWDTLGATLAAAGEANLDKRQALIHVFAELGAAFAAPA